MIGSRSDRAAWHRPLVAVLLVLLVLPAASLVARSETIANPDFLSTWSREDQPVATGVASRTWLWGPEPFTEELTEPYASSPDGKRSVQYWDKARLEINDPAAQRDRWYVTSGLLAGELVTGAMQTGDSRFQQRGPAVVPVAGDSDDATGPTYASFDRVRNAEPFNSGTTLVATIDRSGAVGYDQHFARYNVLAVQHVPETAHTVASVFLDFLNTSGTVVEDGRSVTGRLFEPWYYVTGLPITEAYWASVQVAGEPRDVLIQIFERRVLTYTPSNDPAWRVELGNVGLHYFWWRYKRDVELPQGTGGSLWSPDLTRLPADASGAGWTSTVDSRQQLLTFSHEPQARGLVARYWQQVTGMPVESYRASVDIQMSGAVEAGIGVHLAPAADGLDSMVYFGITADGTRMVTLERFDGGRVEHLLRPVSVLGSLHTAPGSWNTLAVTVDADRAWLEVNAVVIGEIELPGGESASGVAVASGRAGAGVGPVTATFRNLAVESSGD